MLVLIFAPLAYAAGASNISQAYGWNSTNFVPLLTKADGRLMTNINVSQAVGISPITNNTYDLGTTALMWADLYVRNIRSPGVLSLIAGTTEAMTILGNGYVGIQNTTPPERLTINGNLTFTNGPRIMDDNGKLKLQAGGAVNGSGNTSSIYFLDSSGTIRGRLDTNFSSGGPSNSYGTFYMGATNTAAADLAEYYVTGDSSIEAGDVVSLSNTKIISGIEEVVSKGVLRKSTSNDGKLVGVVSTAPGLILGSIDSYGHRDDRLLALAGRTPVKVSSENGPIDIGDYLTSSSTLGVAMKATEPGVVIGRALETFDGTTGKIDALIGVRESNIAADISVRQKQIDLLKEQNSMIRTRISALEDILEGK